MIQLNFVASFLLRSHNHLQMILAEFGFSHQGLPNDYCCFQCINTFLARTNKQQVNVIPIIFMHKLYQRVIYQTRFQILLTTQNHHMQIQTSDSKSEYYLRQQNAMIRLGNVFFSLKKTKHNQPTSFKVLSQFYPTHYIENKVPQLHKKMVKLGYEAQSQEIKTNPYKNFRLQLVHEYQYSFVQMTLQQVFVLKQSSFRIIAQWKNHITLSQNHFWSINFLNLKQLSLSDSKIYNIENLAYCNLPVIEKLQLQKNNITNLSILSKISFPKLKELTIYQNRLIELNQIKQFGASEIKFLGIDEAVDMWLSNGLLIPINFKDDESPGIQRIDFLIKSQFLLKISEFRLRMSKRIPNQRYAQVLKQANKKLQSLIKGDEQRIRDRRRMENMEMFPDIGGEEFINQDENQ